MPPVEIDRVCIGIGNLDPVRVLSVAVGKGLGIVGHELTDLQHGAVEQPAGFERFEIQPTMLRIVPVAAVRKNRGFTSPPEERLLFRPLMFPEIT